MELKEACKDAVEYMRMHHCLHDTLIITQTHAEIVSGQKCVPFPYDESENGLVAKQVVTDPENQPNQFCPSDKCAVVIASQEEYGKLKELSHAFIGDIEEQYGDKGLPDSFMPLLHYLRRLDK
jgi:hypothetical protein